MLVGTAAVCPGHNRKQDHSTTLCHRLLLDSDLARPPPLEGIYRRTEHLNEKCASLDNRRRRDEGRYMAQIHFHRYR